MWENRPAVNKLVHAPCKNCANRKVPKTCEVDCELWQKYVKDKEEIDNHVKEQKKLTQMFVDMYKSNKRKR